MKNLILVGVTIILSISGFDTFATGGIAPTITYSSPTNGYWTYSGPTGAAGATYTASCQALAPLLNTQYYTFAFTSATSTGCTLTETNVNNQSTSQQSYPTVPYTYCAQGTLSGGQCAISNCPTGYTLNPSDGLCYPPSCPASGAAGPATGASFSFQNTGSLPNAMLASYICVSGCAYVAGDAVGSGSGPGQPNDTSVWVMLGKATGNSCTSSDAGLPSVALSQVVQTAASCAANGFGSISMGGVTQCVPQNNAPAIASAVAGAAAGTAAAGGTPAEQQAAASAVAAIGAATGSAPPVVVTIDATNPVTDFCAKNPTASMCQPFPAQSGVQFPPDLAKTQDIQAAASGIEAAIDQLNATMSASGVVPGSIAAVSAPATSTDIFTALQNAQSTDASTVSSMFNWTPPSQASCQPFTGTFGMWHYSVDICPMVIWLRGILAWLVAVLAIYDIFGVLTSRG